MNYQVNKIAESLEATFLLGLENGKEDFQQTSKQSKEILNAAAKLFEADSFTTNIDIESTTLPDLIKEQKKLLEARRRRVDPMTIERYAEFAKKLETMRNNFQEVDGLAEEPERRRIDPISKKPIRIPVMNSRCKHIYDKEVILEAIRMNNHLRCPYMGCSNKRVHPADLVEDTGLTMEYDADEDVPIEIDE